MENPFEIILEKLNSIEKMLEKLNAAPNKVNEDEFMNIEEVAKFVGLSKATIYGLTHERNIPHCKRGKRLYFKKSEIVDWITTSKVKTSQEIKQMADEYIYKNPLH